MKITIGNSSSMDAILFGRIMVVPMTLPLDLVLS
jgi:hypothetical protein